MNTTLHISDSAQNTLYIVMSIYLCILLPFIYYCVEDIRIRMRIAREEPLLEIANLEI
jgi:hypothetical protein